MERALSRRSFDSAGTTPVPQGANDNPLEKPVGVVGRIREARVALGDANSRVRDEWQNSESPLKQRLAGITTKIHGENPDGSLDTRSLGQKLGPWARAQWIGFKSWGLGYRMNNAQADMDAINAKLLEPGVSQETMLAMRREQLDLKGKIDGYAKRRGELAGDLKSYYDKRLKGVPEAKADAETKYNKALEQRGRIDAWITKRDSQIKEFDARFAALVSSGAIHDGSDQAQALLVRMERMSKNIAKLKEIRGSVVSVLDESKKKYDDLDKRFGASQDQQAEWALVEKDGRRGTNAIQRPVQAPETPPSIRVPETRPTRATDIPAVETRTPTQPESAQRTETPPTGERLNDEQLIGVLTTLLKEGELTFEDDLQAVLKDLLSQEKGEQPKNKMIRLWNALAEKRPDDFPTIKASEESSFKKNLTWETFATTLKTDVKCKPVNIIAGMKLIIRALQQNRAAA